MTMTRDEDVIIEAKKYYRNDINCYNAFLHGVEWADNNIGLSSIWNDINIAPSNNKSIIYLTKNGKLGVISQVKSNKWNWYVDDKYSIIKWAYSSDLLPKGGGK